MHAARTFGGDGLVDHRMLRVCISRIAVGGLEGGQWSELGTAAFD
ncbi:hypothetical protein [Kribbella sp. VKM Ac-2568]|nr:hypothetical protein [Kribbella sp. VKM Ac-2568]